MEPSKLKIQMVKAFELAEAQYKKGKHAECLRILNRIELRLKSHQLPDDDESDDGIDLYQLYDRRCLVYRRTNRYPKAREDAASMISLKPKAPKGYLCSAKIYEMERNVPMAMKVYRAGLENIAKDDPGYQRFKDAFVLFQRQVTAATATTASDGATPGTAPKLTDPMLVLPYPDIFHTVLEYVPTRTVLACTEVSKLWRQTILADQNLWCQGLDLSVKFYKWTQAALRVALKPAVSPSASLMIKSLKIDRIHPNHEIPCLNIIAQTLSGRIEKVEIELETIALFSVFAERSGPIFGGLVSLTLTSAFSCEILEGLLNMVPTLRELSVTCLTSYPPSWYSTLINVNEIGGPGNTTLPNRPYLLERLSLTRLQNVGTQSPFLVLIGNRLPSLKHLLIHYDKKISIGNGIHALLGNPGSLPSLESVSIKNDHTFVGYHVMSNNIKNISISNTAFHSAPPIAVDQLELPYYTTEELRISRCSLNTTPLLSISTYFDHFKCGPALVHLFLEFTPVLSIFSLEGYQRLVALRFPRLRTISLAGNSQVTNETAKAISKSANVPRNVVLSLTSVSDEGFDLLVKAGVKRLGLQGCSNVTMRSTAQYLEMGIKYLEYRRFS